MTPLQALQGSSSLALPVLWELSPRTLIVSQVQAGLWVPIVALVWA